MYNSQEASLYEKNGLRIKDFEITVSSEDEEFHDDDVVNLNQMLFFNLNPLANVVLQEIPLQTKEKLFACFFEQLDSQKNKRNILSGT